MHVYLCACSCVCDYMCVSVWYGEARGPLCMSSSGTLDACFGPLIGPELPSSRVLLSPSPSPEPGLHVDTGDGTQVLMHVRRALYRPSHPPASVLPLYMVYFHTAHSASLTMNIITAAAVLLNGGVIQLCSDLTIPP